MAMHIKCEECGKKFLADNSNREYINGQDVCSECADKIAAELGIPDDERGQ